MLPAASSSTLFKEVQRYKTQLDQYTDLTENDQARMEEVLPKDQLQGFKGVYLETAQRLKAQQDKNNDTMPEDVDQLDFEFVLFASEIIDYDYIMGLIAKFSQQPAKKQKITRGQLVRLIQSDAKFMDEQDDIAAYIDTLELGSGLSEKEVRDGYDTFKAQKNTQRVAEIATNYGITQDALQAFIDDILRRKVFDDADLTTLPGSPEFGLEGAHPHETHPNG